jgi:hypothetical protein
MQLTHKPVSSLNFKGVIYIRYRLPASSLAAASAPTVTMISETPLNYFMQLNALVVYDNYFYSTTSY